MRLAFYNCSLWTTQEIWKKKVIQHTWKTLHQKPENPAPSLSVPKSKIQTIFYLQVTHLKWLQLLQIFSAITWLCKDSETEAGNLQTLIHLLKILPFPHGNTDFIFKCQLSGKAM